MTITNVYQVAAWVFGASLSALALVLLAFFWFDKVVRR